MRGIVPLPVLMGVTSTWVRLSCFAYALFVYQKMHSEWEINRFVHCLDPVISLNCRFWVYSTLFLLRNSFSIVLSPPLLSTIVNGAPATSTLGLICAHQFVNSLCQSVGGVGILFVLNLPLIPRTCFLITLTYLPVHVVGS